MASQRLGGASLVVAALLFLVGFILHPTPPGENGLPALEETAEIITGDIGVWYLSHALLIIFPVFFLVGILTLHPLLAERDDFFSLPATVLLVLSGILFLVLLVIDGFAEPLIHEIYVATADQARQSVAMVLEYSFAITLTMVAIFFILLMAGGGVLGASLLRAELYNRAFGWVGVILGAVGILGYMGGLFGTYFVLSLLFAPYAVILTIWFLVLGVLLYRGE